MKPIAHCSRRQLLVGAAAGLAAGTFFPFASAQAPAWPAKPITMLIGFPAGGTTDVIGRLVAADLGARLGQPVIVDNRGGAGGTIAVTALHNAAPDGYTLMMLVIPTVNFQHFLGKKIDYVKDFEPVAEIYDQYNVLVVNPAVPEFTDVQTLQQLIATAKARPGALNYGSTGIGSLGHLTTERICAEAGIRMQHVAYKGSAPAMTDLLGGQIGVMYSDSQTALPHIRSGKLRAIAVSSAQRQADLPNVATMTEQGLPGLVAVPWGGMVAPAKTPKVVIDRISAELKASLDSSEVRDKLRAAGVTPAYKTAADFGDFANAESAAWGKVIADRGIKPE